MVVELICSYLFGDELSILKIVKVIIKMIRIIAVNSLFIYDIFTTGQSLASGLCLLLILTIIL